MGPGGRQLLSAPESARAQTKSGRTRETDNVPRPARRPFALVSPGAHGMVVSAVNQSARRAGVQVGQTVSDARAIFPGLVTRQADPQADAVALKQIALWAGRYGPNRNVDGCDGIWVEISGVAHLFGDETGLANDLARRLARSGLTAHIAIAETPGAAHALARFANRGQGELTIAASGRLETALAPLDVEALRLSQDSICLLKRLGLRRVGQLSELPRAALARRFREDTRTGRKADREALARAVVWRLDQAFGRMPEPRAPLEEPPLRTFSQAFEDPLISAQGIESALQDLAGRMSHDLTHRAEGARRMRLCLYRSDGSRAAIAVGASAPTSDAAHIANLFWERLDTIDAGMGIDLIALEASQVSPLKPSQRTLSRSKNLRSMRAQNHAASIAYTAQQSHANGLNAGDPCEAVSQLTDRLINRLGSDNVLRLARAGSHIPELAERQSRALHEGSKAPTADEETVRPRASQGPRPAFLLSRPEQIMVVAQWPEGAPARFSWRRITRRIARSQGPERIAPEWWRTLAARQALANAIAARDADDPCETSKAAARHAAAADCADGPAQDHIETLARALPRTRDYYMLEDELGGRYWVFRDGLYDQSEESGSPAWYIHGLFG